MKCLNCNNDQFIEQNTRFTPELRGEIIEVIAPCMVCKKCNTPLMNTEQMSVLRRISVDKYREIHGLLTSLEIITYREKLGMSQSSLARYLNVGEASIKRWETYYIQDASQDELIRLKCDEAAAEMNYLDVQWKQDEPNIYNGNRKFNLQLFKNVALFLIEHTKESKKYLNKLHFYIDFLHFKLHSVSLTGARYTPLKLGPCPDQYRAIYSAFVNKNYIKEAHKYTYEIQASCDLSLFDDNEKATLELVLRLYHELGPEKILELSHQENGYIETEECSFISYKFAEHLQIIK